MGDGLLADSGDEDLVDIELKRSSALAASVMGAAGQAQGLALTTGGESFFDDLERIRILPGRKITPEIVALSYAELNEIPPEARREVRKLKLPLAGPAAYPMLHVMGGRAGGLPRDRPERFLAVLEAFVECFEQEFGPAELTTDEGWWSEDGSVCLRAPEKRDPLDDWPGEVDKDHLESGRTVGPGADWRVCRPFLDDPDERLFDAERLQNSFRRALENQGLAESTVKKHVANAEHLFEYLTGWAGVRPEALHEYDLRTFLYDWYPHKGGASETEAKSVHASLDRLFAYLEGEPALEFPWAARLLGERETLRTRWETNVPGPFWDSDVQDWRSVLSAHLDAFAMLPRNTLGDDETWGARMGMRESALDDQLLRQWLHWRDEAIESGVVAWDDLLPLLWKMQRTWETSPHDRLGRSPYEVIVEERRKIESKLAKSRES